MQHLDHVAGSVPEEPFSCRAGSEALVDRFLINISINRVHMANSNLIHFVFPLKDNWHLVDLVNVLKDPFFELRF